MPDNKAPRDKENEKWPIGPDLEIVPTEEKSTEEEIKKERCVIDELVKKDVRLPWVQPPQLPKRGKG